MAAPSVAKDDDTKIVAGTDASITDAPWQVAILQSNVDADYSAQFCGGSIVAAQWIVTAAHCVVNGTSVSAPSSIEVLAGKDFLSTDPATSGPRTPVSQVIPHPSYNDSTYANDVAMLRLGVPLTLDGVNRKAIALPDSVPAGWPAIGPGALITGWGSTVQVPFPTPEPPPTPSYPQQLQKAEIDVLAGPGDPCGSYGAGYDEATQLCAARIAPAPVKDTCQGDSGGPLRIEVSGTPTLAGITSIGAGCADASYPGLYTRVTAFKTWINAQMGLTPGFSATPASLDFGTGNIGDRSTRSITVSNPGTATMYLQSVDVGSPFTVDAAACGSTLQPGTSCVVSVTFAPASAGVHSSQVRFIDDAGGSPQVVPVSGTGVEKVVAPAAPTKLTGKATTKKVKFSWHAVTGATSYKVKVSGKKKNGKKASATKSTSSTSTTVKIKLKKKSKAKACVKAVNSAGESSWTCKKFKVK